MKVHLEILENKLAKLFAIQATIPLEARALGTSFNSWETAVTRLSGIGVSNKEIYEVRDQLMKEGFAWLKNREISAETLSANAFNLIPQSESM
jgi:hypothetical protein